MKNIIVSGCGNAIGRYVCDLISGQPGLKVVAGLSGTNESIIDFDFDLFVNLGTITANSLPFIGKYVASLLAAFSVDTSVADWNPFEGYKFPIYPYEKIQEAIDYSIKTEGTKPDLIITCDNGLSEFSGIPKQFGIMELFVQPDFVNAYKAVTCIPQL